MSNKFEELDKLLVPLDVALDRQQFMEAGKQLAYTEARLILMENGITALEAMKRIGVLAVQSVRHENELSEKIKAHDAELDAAFNNGDDPFDTPFFKKSYVGEVKL